MSVTIAITAGCPSGIGLELLPAALAAAEVPPDVTLLFCGPRALLEIGARRAGVNARRDDEHTGIEVGGHRVDCVSDSALPSPLREAAITDAACRAGAPGPEALAIQRESLLLAIGLAERGEVDGIVTLPIRKRALDDVDDGRFPGHTELLGERLGDGNGPALMVFAGGPFLLGLATVHLPLAHVSAAITKDNIRHAIGRLLAATRAVTGSNTPRLAVLGHNPHAGEDGRLGDEEKVAIGPAIAAVRAEAAADIVGPLPADGFFAHFRANVPDAVLAMHHDQGLGPYKILSEGAGVNLTWGLKCVRTSPDHGTADGLAGSGTADPSSLAAALRLCVHLAQRASR